MSSSDIMAIRKDYKRNDMRKIKLRLHALKLLTQPRYQKPVLLHVHVCISKIFCHNTIPTLPVQPAKPVFCKTQCGQFALVTAEGVLPYWVEES